MDIVMIGHSGAGKTSYMAAMYEAMSSGVSGFSVRAERQADHTALVKDARLLQKGKFPPASSQRKVYRLQLWFSGQRVFDFVWHDYRGGALTETSSSRQAMELRSDLATGGGLVILLDSTELTGGIRAQARVRPLVATAIRMLSQQESVMPMAIVLTKWDLVRNVDKTLDAAGDVFGELVDAVAKTSNICGALIPVSTTQDLVSVTLPVMWCLHIGIAIRQVALMEAIKQQYTVAQVAAVNDTWWDRTKSWFNGETPWKDIHAQTLAAARAQEAHLEPLIAPSQGLSVLLDPIAKF